MASYGGPSYPSTAYILCLIGGIFILLGGLVEAAVFAVLGSAVISLIPGLGALLIGLAVLALIFGLIIIYGAFQMKSHPQSAKTWGIIILIMAIISLFGGGGGFFIGFLLALIGASLALVWHPPAPTMTQAAWGAPPPLTAAPAPPPGAASAGAGQKFCSSCGSPNNPGTQFCVKCGAAMPP